MQFILKEMKQRKIQKCPSCREEFAGPLVQAQVDVSMAMEIVKKVTVQKYTKVVLLSGDKDFSPVIDFLRDVKEDLEFWVVGFKHGMAPDLQSKASRDCVYFLDNDIGMFFNPKKWSQRAKHRGQENQKKLSKDLEESEIDELWYFQNAQRLIREIEESLAVSKTFQQPLKVLQPQSQNLQKIKVNRDIQLTAKPKNYPLKEKLLGRF